MPGGIDTNKLNPCLFHEHDTLILLLKGRATCPTIQIDAGLKMGSRAARRRGLRKYRRGATEHPD
jgi:hypothetical protein